MIYTFLYANQYIYISSHSNVWAYLLVTVKQVSSIISSLIEKQKEAPAFFIQPASSWLHHFEHHMIANMSHTKHGYIFFPFCGALRNFPKLYVNMLKIL